MKVLGLAPKKTSSAVEGAPGKRPIVAQNGSSDDAKKLAAAALSAVKDAAAAAALGRGKMEVRSLFCSQCFTGWSFLSLRILAMCAGKMLCFARLYLH